MKKVPFYSNTEDDTHCVQAVFRMALAYFVPQKEYSWQVLDKMTHKQVGKGTWWFPAVAGLKREGLQIKYIEQFDYSRYINEGDAYLNEFYGPQIADWFLASSNISQVKHLIPEFIKISKIQTRSAKLEDIDSLLIKGWLVGVEINVRSLQKRDGFNGHMVLIYQKQKDNYIVHDPGLPALPSRSINVNNFYKAWAYAGDSKTSLIAFKAGE